MRLNLKYGDFLVILAIILIAVLFVVSFYEGNTDEKIAIVSQNGIVLDRIELNKISDRYEINYFGEYPGTIEINNGRIRFLHADCPDQVCVNTGWIDRPGQIAVCLPAGVIIKIEGVQTDVDIIVR
ncbi:MAG: NusG domain II-containing protein [Clostridiaceae bacterium]|nr:NusG domain II-containing protein [Clostridiaceae bacterium]